MLQLVARGHRYAEIGAELSISPKTAENHVRNILGKLHLSRRTDLVRYAVRHGLDCGLGEPQRARGGFPDGRRRRGIRDDRRHDMARADQPVRAPAAPPAPPPAPPVTIRRATARPVAAWLAATGGSLVLVAAAIVAVAGNWQDIAAWIKLAGLLTITTTVIVGAERARSSLPATARAMAHLGAALRRAGRDRRGGDGRSGRGRSACSSAGVRGRRGVRRPGPPVASPAARRGRRSSPSGSPSPACRRPRAHPRRRARRGRRAARCVLARPRTPPRRRSPSPARRRRCSSPLAEQRVGPGRSTGSAPRATSWRGARRSPATSPGSSWPSSRRGATRHRSLSPRSPPRRSVS